jgi:L-threonylcarbamoyladenylate synthase
MITEILQAESPDAVMQAIQLIQGGGLVAFPTDTVYGLAAMAFNEQAIERLYMVKGRDSAKAVAVLLGTINHLPLVTSEPGEISQRLGERFWPGPLTLVIRRHPSLPDILSPTPTIGIRIPDHDLALSLLNGAGPLAVSSANLSGGPSACTAEEVYAQLGGRIPLILDGGATPGGIPSTVIDCTGNEPLILRSGPISLNDIQNAVK